MNIFDSLPSTKVTDVGLDFSNWGLDAGSMMNQGLSPLTWGERFSSGFKDMSNAFSQHKDLLNFGFQGAKGLFDAYNSFNQNKAMKDLLNFQKEAYRNNLAMTRKTTNMELADRQRRRVSANPNAESVESYMQKWGV